MVDVPSIRQTSFLTIRAFPGSAGSQIPYSTSTRIRVFPAGIPSGGPHPRYWRHRVKNDGVLQRCQTSTLSGWSPLRYDPAITSPDLRRQYPRWIFTGKIPFPNSADLIVPFLVTEGRRPSKPTEASRLGLSSDVWRLVQDCWKQRRKKRPEIQYVTRRLREVWYVCIIYLAQSASRADHTLAWAVTTESGPLPITVWNALHPST